MSGWILLIPIPFSAFPLLLLLYGLLFSNSTLRLLKDFHFGSPQKQSLRQGFEYNSFIQEVIPGALEAELGDETGTWKKPIQDVLWSTEGHWSSIPLETPGRQYRICLSIIPTNRQGSRATIYPSTLDPSLPYGCAVSGARSPSHFRSALCLGWACCQPEPRGSWAFRI